MHRCFSRGWQSFAVVCATFWMSAVGCECGEGGTLQRVVPEIAAEPMAIDFGEIPLGATRRSNLTISNPGLGVLTIASVDAMGPFTATLETTQIPAGGSGIIDVAFTATSEEPAMGSLNIMSDASNTPMLQVALTGLGVAGFVDVQPATLDLVGTTVGTSRTIELEVSNLGLEMVSGRILTESFPRAEHYALTGLSRFDEPGNYAVPPRSKVVLDLEYRPLLSGQDDGRILFETCGPRCGVEVMVTASGVEATVRLEPGAIDFGPVGIGQTKSETVTIFNDGDLAVQISSASTVGTEFQISPPVTTPLTIDPRSQAVINLEFTPSEAGTSMGEFIVETTDSAVAQAKVRMVGRGEGPLFRVQPEAIHFGIQRTLNPVQRPLLLLNAGSAEVQVGSIEINGDAELSLINVPGLPVRLGAGESVTASIQFAPTGQGMFSANVVIQSSDEGSAMVTVPVQAAQAEQSCQLDTAPSRLNFGLIPVNYQRDGGVLITNSGNQACSVLSGGFVAPIDPAFSVIAEPWPLMLNPGDTHELVLRYEPTDARQSKGKYELRTDDPIFMSQTIALVGSSEAYTDVFTLPTALDFGQTRPGCSAGTAPVTIFNAGTTDVVVEQVALTSTTADLSLVNPPSTPFSVRAGDSRPINMVYNASDIGTDFAELVVQVADLPFPLITPVQGAGINRPSARDVFRQNPRREVDVLFVVDNSCSMADEQMQLASNFAAFITTANLRNVDFQIGVTTTDVQLGERGRLVGPIIRRTPGHETVFQQQTVLGTSGSGREQGLEAMLLALQLADQGVMPNAGLLRPNAQFVAIIISDEDDQSPASEVTYFNELRNRAINGFTTAVVSGGPTGCRHPNSGTALRSQKYLRFLNLTGGIHESICAQNWASTLANIGSVAFGLRERFFLSQPADPNMSITVRVDGNVVPMSDYTYDAAEGSIRFMPNAVPPENSQVEIDYVPTC